MNLNYFFVELEDPDWDLNGRDPWDRMETVLNTDLIESIRIGTHDQAHDIDIAYGLTQLAHEELLAYGTGGNQRLNDDEITAVLRALRSILKRAGIDFDPPFRSFGGFHGYWSNHDMGGSWAARRGYLNELFSPILSRLDELEDGNTHGSMRGVDGQPRNLIFGSTGPKPQIVLRDAINNIIEVTRNAEYCLFYDQPLGASGLTWGELVGWWRRIARLDTNDDAAVGRHLYGRLSESLINNPAELLVFRTYSERYGDSQAGTLPALLPQVYLHYDPLTRRHRKGQPGVLTRERMDFLLLLPRRVRIVIEIDGKQHYSDGETASPKRYAEMMSEDRRLRLHGYEVYRFGGFELMQPDATAMLRSFFNELLGRYMH